MKLAYLKWAASSLAYIVMELFLVWYVGAVFVAMFTKAEVDTDNHDWGGWWGTYDNPPQGDRKWLRECPFPQVTTGLKGYINRVGWMWRNRGYNFKKMLGVSYHSEYTVFVSGDETVSDKQARPGSHYTEVVDHDDKLVAFQYYIVYPYPFWKSKCFRAKLGWKVHSDKFYTQKFAALVLTANPFKTYGESLESDHS